MWKDLISRTYVIGKLKSSIRLKSKIHVQLGKFRMKMRTTGLVKV
jgi:hypothetical protein